MGLIALEVFRAGRVKSTGFVGKSNSKNWPTAKTLETAEKWSTKVLAEGAASQYLSYIRKKHPTLVGTISLRHVECD